MNMRGVGHQRSLSLRLFVHRFLHIADRTLFKHVQIPPQQRQKCISFCLFDWRLARRFFVQILIDHRG
jgi:hypothetical protein